MSRTAAAAALVFAATATLSCGSSKGAATGGSPVVPSQRVLRRLDLTDKLPATVRAGCRKAAKPFVPAVYCPPLVPAGPANPNIDYNAMRGRRRGSWTYILDFGSASLNHVDGHPVDANGGHWNVGATTDTWVRDELFLRERSVRKSMKRIRVAGRAATSYEIPRTLESYFAGHFVVTWTVKGVEYFASAHAFANRPRVLAMAAALVRLQRACGTHRETRGPCRSVLTAK